MERDLIARAELPDGIGIAVPAAGYPRTLTHFGGVEAFSRRPERFVAISTGQFDAAVAVGVVPVASARNNSGEMIPAYLGVSRWFDASAHRAAIDAVVDLGQRTAPDLDLLASLDPDLISATLRGVGGRLYPALHDIAPTVLSEGKGFNWKQDALLIGAALGREARMRTVLDDYATRASGFAAAGTRFGRNRIHRSPLSVVRFGPLGLEIHGRWSFAGSIATDLGLERPESQNTDRNGTLLDLSAPEAIDAALAGIDEGLVVYSRIDAPAARAAWDVIARQPRWRAAVSAGRVFEVGASNWHGHAGPLAAHAVIDDLERIAAGAV